jgi:uncharacterized membrane protein
MEGLMMLGLLGLLLMFIGSVCGVRAMQRVKALDELVKDLRRRLNRVENTPAPSAPEPVPAPRPEPPRPPRPAPARVVPPRLPEIRPIPQPPSPAPARLEPLPAAAPAPLPNVQKKAAPEKEGDWIGRFEQRVGKRWMTWAGALILFLSAGFFVKLAIDSQWVSVRTRDVTGMVFGIVLAAAGVRFTIKKMTALGQGLIGSGLAICYVSLYAAHGLHGWLGAPQAFGAMALVSALGITLAVLFDARPISILAMVGGFLTPAVVPAAAGRADVLFTYLLILDLSVLGVAFFKQWRSLDVLAFAGTVVLFLSWFGTHYQPAVMTPTMLWLGSFYLLFMILPFVYHVRRKTPITVERFVMALANASGFCMMAYHILADVLWSNRPHALGAIVLGMGVAYAAFAVLCRLRLPADRRSLLSFVALSVTFVTMSVPLHFGLNGVALCWAVEAPVLLYLGYRFRYLPLRAGAFAMLMLTLGRFFLMHWPLHTFGFPIFRNAEYGVALWTVLCMAAFACIHHWHRAQATALGGMLKQAAAIAAGFLALVVTHAEIVLWFWFMREGSAVPHHYPGWSGAIVVWAMGAAAFVAVGIRTRSLIPRLAAYVSACIALVLVVMLYGVTAPEGVRTLLNIRFAASCSAVLVLLAGATAMANRPTGDDAERRLLSPALAFAGYAALVLVNAEIFTYDTTYRGWCYAVLVWTVGAAAFLSSGAHWRRIGLRLAGGLALFVAVVLTVPLYAAELPSGAHAFWNARFASVMGIVAVAFGYALLLSRRDDLSADELRSIHRKFVMAGLLLLVLVSVEALMFRTFYDAVRFVVIAWSCGGLAFGATGLLWKSPSGRRAAWFTFGLALLGCVLLYGLGVDEPAAVFFNTSFFTALAPIAGLFLCALLTHGLRDRTGGGPSAGALFGVAVHLLLALMSLERFVWVPEYQAWLANAATWTAGAFALLLLGVVFKSRAARQAGRLALAPALLMSVTTYTFDNLPPSALFINGRFAVTLAGVLAVATSAWLPTRWPERHSDDEPAIALPIYTVFGILMFALLSYEPWSYCMRTFASERAQYSAQMALTVVWSVFATALLSVGFLRKLRPLRLTALALFAVTALKLLFIDLAWLEQVYRIISFFVMGVLMIAASYLYHKVEKRLVAGKSPTPAA